MQSRILCFRKTSPTLISWPIWLWLSPPCLVLVLVNGFFGYNLSSQPFLTNSFLPQVLLSGQAVTSVISSTFLFSSRCITKGNVLFNPSPTDLGTTYKPRSTTLYILGKEQAIRSYLVFRARGRAHNPPSGWKAPCSLDEVYEHR